jgi:hypothetical protein
MARRTDVVEEAKAPTAPYISFRTFLNLLDKLHSGGVPQHIDRHYWGVFLAGSTGQQVMAALRFLGLITPENKPTPMLERLVDPTERKAALKELLDERYAGLSERGVDVSRTTPGYLERAFGELYNVDGETRRKAVTFYVHAAQFADIPLSQHVTAKTRQRRAPTGRTRAKPGQPAPPAGNVSERLPAKEQPPTPQNTGPYAILHALLDQLPPEGRWTSPLRTRWLAALQANVDFLITVEDEPDTSDDYDYADYEDEGEEELPE